MTYKNNYTIKRILLILGFFFFLLTPKYFNAQKYFKISPDLERAYTSINNLQLTKAQNILDSLKISEPRNMLVYHIENYIDFYKIFINEDYNEFIDLEKNKKYRLNKIKEGDKNSPYYKFSKAEILLQWALARLKFEEYTTAAFEVRSAFKALQKNKKQHPDFVANNKSLSVIHAITGTLPDLYKGIFKLISGLDGTIKQGANEIEEVINYSNDNYFLFKDEAYTISSFIAFHLENNKEKAWKIIESANLDIKNSPLACFVLANMAQNTNRNEYAIKVLQNKPYGNGRLPFYYLDYMLGNCKLYRNDKDALIYLQSFVNNFNGINYIKDAYLKIAWYELIVNGETKAYWENIEKCKSKGKAIVDEDKTAYKEAIKHIKPNPILLKARLLYDGGYFVKAYSYLIQHEKVLVNSKEFNIEFNYRMGRILQSLDSYFDAISYYETTISNGIEGNSHFSCNAALQTGIIYEKLRKYTKAKKYYKLCLDINPNEYKNSLHQKAKAGLIRIDK